MSNLNSALPAPLVDRYWFEVEWELRHRHGMSPQQASDAIARYRAAMAAAQVGDMLYHADVAETAKAVKDAGHVRGTP